MFLTFLQNHQNKTGVEKTLEKGKGESRWKQKQTKKFTKILKQQCAENENRNRHKWIAEKEQEKTVLPN